MNTYYDTEEVDDELQVDFLGLFFKYVSYWKLFLMSLALCLVLAILYLKIVTPIYEVNTTILLKDDKKGGGTSELGQLKDLGLLDVKNNVDNELEVLKTSNLTEEVVRELGLYVSYTEIRSFNNKILYGNNNPLRISLSNVELNKIKDPIEFKVIIFPHDEFEFSGTYNDKDFRVKATSKDSTVVLPFGKVYYKCSGLILQNQTTIGIKIQKPVKIANKILKKMSLELTSQNTSVVNITLKTSNVEQGMDFLYKLIDVYNREDMKDQNLVATNTNEFVSNRLDSLTKELKDVETQVENYKQSQGLTDIQSEAELFIKKTGDYEQKRLDVETQLAVVSDMDEYIHKKENRYHLLPTGTGIQSQSLNELINNYNKLLLERNRYARTATATNQSMIDLTAQIDGVYSTVQSSIQNEKRNLQIVRQDLLKQDHENAGRIKAIPRQEREYAEIKRQQGIKESLYLFLLQKKEENSLNMMVVVPKAKIIDTPSSNDIPVFPKSLVILLVSFILGIILPIIGLAVRDLLRYHIENKEELEKISIVPILGEIAKSEQTGNIIIRENGTNRITEMFRLLRTNLMYLLNDADQQVINVVSSIGGEGKTFICINLAISLALLDKKVLIVGLDVRKPKLGDYIGLDNKLGITMYLSGNLNENEIIRPSGIHPNLSVITAGPVPPNPGELMAKPALDTLIADCKKKYDYIIIDTAPLGIVSDAYLLNRFADVTLYLVRADYTPKKNIEDATHLFKQNKLNRMYFLLNATDFHKASFRNGYGAKYGYGYGNKYGYGNGYGEDDK
ncbi:MAG: polysaccharide biosynthesis tyrosine autokinase [Paludibacter sp.]|nr:polysaccharide biosynthesis tyrosine autokinase [Paludibacter sp.]